MTIQTTQQPRKDIKARYSRPGVNVDANGNPLPEYLRRQRGATTADFLAWGGLAALVILGIVGTLYVAQRQQAPKNEAANIMSIYTSAKNSRDLAGYTNVNTASLQRDGGIPSSMVGSTSGTVYHSWDGTVTVTGTATAFTITYGGVPEDQCNGLRSLLTLGGNYTAISACNASGPTDLTITGR